MEWITNIVDRVFVHINKTFQKTTCASECCTNRCECKNEGESSGEEVEVPAHHRDQETKIIFTTKLEFKRLSQNGINPSPPPSTLSD
jgi:hypothetical protein